MRISDWSSDVCSSDLMTMACFQNSAAPGGIKRGRCPPIASPRRDLALSFRQTVSAALTQYGGGQGMRDSGYFLEIIHTGMVNAGLNVNAIYERLGYNAEDLPLREMRPPHQQIGRARSRERGCAYV